MEYGKGDTEEVQHDHAIVGEEFRPDVPRRCGIAEGAR